MGDLRDLAVVGSLAVTWALSGRNRPFGDPHLADLQPLARASGFSMTRVVSFLYDPAQPGAGLSLKLDLDFVEAPGCNPLIWQSLRREVKLDL